MKKRKKKPNRHRKFGMLDVDDDPVYTKLPGMFFLTCCDCGLRHLVVIEKHRKGVRVGFERDNVGTDLERRDRKHKKNA